MKINFIPALLVFLFSGALLLAAGAAAAAKIDLPLIGNEKTEQKELAVAKLNDIIRNIKLQKMEAEAKSRLLMKAKTEQEKNKIQTELNELSDAIAEQESSFEMILTAGLELSREETVEKREFDWKKDLLEIVQPIMSELRQFTEKKRKTDNLQKKIDFYKSQIRIIQEVLKHIAGINKAGFEKEALTEFERIAGKWQNQLEENQHLLEVVQLQL
ncbi:MAG: hypothetical protein JSS06_02795, partial [Proteobacteria bacterium]|nr:hypothetical protein [Pseudomonadota bacterium]